MQASGRSCGAMARSARAAGQLRAAAFRPFGRACPLRCAASTSQNQAGDAATTSAAPSPPAEAATAGPSTVAAPLVAAAALALMAGPCHAAGVPLGDISDADSIAMAALGESILRPVLTLGTLLYICRIPMSWYPEIDGKLFPWNIVYVPTEPILTATRKVVPLVGGVDVTPIVWVGLLSFLSEVLIGPQGILILIQRQTGMGL